MTVIAHRIFIRAFDFLERGAHAGEFLDFTFISNQLSIMDVDGKDALCAFVDALDGPCGSGGGVDEGVQKPAVSDENLAGGWPSAQEDRYHHNGDVDSGGDAWSKNLEYGDDDGTSSNTWMDMTNVFDNWLCCLIDTDRRICTPGKSLRSDRINQSIDGMLEDGLIGFSDASELRFIGTSWIRLLNCYALYSAGCRSYKRDIVSLLIELYASKQIGKELCIQICTEL